MTDKPTTNQLRLPSKIRSKLRRIVWHYKLLDALRGLVVTAWVSLIILGVVLLIASRLDEFSKALRWAAFGIWAGVTCLFFVRYFLLKLTKSFSINHAALLVDSNHSELHERISSTVELANQARTEENIGSRQLIDALTDQADRDIRKIRSFLEISPTTLLIPFAILVICCGVILFPLWNWPDKTKLLLQAVLVPTADISNMAAVDLVITPDSDSVLLEGEKIDVRMMARTGKVKSAEIQISDPNLPARKNYILEKLLPDQPLFGYTLQAKNTSFRYRILCNDAKSRWYTVRVVPRPSVQQIDIRYTLPKYTGIKPIVLPKSTGDIENLPGTIVDLEIKCDGLLDSADMLLNDKVFLPAKVTASDGKSTCKISFVLDEKTTGLWKLRMTNHVDQRKLVTDEPQAHKIQSMNDTHPLVDIEKPRLLRVDLKHDGKLQINYRLRDDFAITSAKLQAEFDGQPQHQSDLEFQHHPVTMPGAMQQYTGSTVFDLSDFELSKTREIKLTLSAKDNNPESRSGYSKPIIITLNNSADSPEMQALKAQQDAISKSLDDAVQQLQQASEQNQQLREQIAAGQSPDQNNLDAQAISDQLENIQNNLRLLADNVEKNTQYDISTDIRDTASQEVQKAKSSASQIQSDQSPAQHDILARQVDQQIQMAQQKLQSISQDVDQMTKLAEKTEQLNQLAEMGEQLKDTPDTADLQKQFDQQLKHLSDEMNSASSQNTSPQNESAGELSNSLAQIASRQNQLSREINKTGGASGSPQQQMRDIQAQQIQNARDIVELSDDIRKNKNPAEAAQARQAAQDAVNAASELEKANNDQAQQLAQSSGQQLEKLSQDLKNSDNAKNQDFANRAGELSKNQQQIVQNINSLKNSDSAQQAAQQQQTLSQESAQVAQQLKDMQSSQPSRQLSQAQQQTQQAAKKQQQATQSLADGQTAQAVTQQQAAERALRQASQTLQKIAPQFQQAQPPQPVQNPSGQTPPQLDTQQIAQLLQQIQSEGMTPQSAQKLRQLAGQTMDAAKKMGLGTSISQEGLELGKQAGDESLAGSDQPLPDIDLEALSIGADDWARLPGKLKTQLLQSAGNTGPQVYQKQIGDYYKALSNMTEEE